MPSMTRRSVENKTNNNYIRNPGKLHQLIHGCIEQGIEIVAIQEHRWQTNQQVDIYLEILDERNIWRFDFCSATPKGQGGVGILMNSRLSKSLISTEKISERIMVAHFAGNPVTTLIIAYAPTEDKSDSEKDKFYEDLQKCTKDIPIHNVLIILGDFNARIGKDNHLSNPKTIGPHVFHEESNENGKRLVDFCEMANMRPV
ncbi:LINE-1 retrotransposable element ORF2 [Labeo rohita]|uniref:LINE-1 retrotransposable element ORF2 n=1 Tax=Labeo rohita TaxID=84645 RepID=A0A498P106_LABRO|nr:LINE-1 retrotransposable element ORF2 [Labeo rohita]